MMLFSKMNMPIIHIYNVMKLAKDHKLDTNSMTVYDHGQDDKNMVKDQYFQNKLTMCL